jgi:hypothetical protein
VFEEIMLRLLSQQGPEMVILPSKSLYIEALPGTGDAGRWSGEARSHIRDD